MPHSAILNHSSLGANRGKYVHNLASGIGFRQIWCIWMDVEDHVGRMEMHCSVWVSCKIVKYLQCFFHRLLGPFCLLAGDCTECHQHCHVYHTRILQDASHNFLGAFYLFFIKFVQCSNLNWLLHICAIFSWLWWVGTMLLTGGDHVVVFLKLALYIPRHQNIKRPHVVISV